MKTLTSIIGLAGLICGLHTHAALPPDYQGKPFEDAKYKAGAQVIPGRIECAYYDLGGEGVAYHDTDPSNNGNGVLNQPETRPKWERSRFPKPGRSC